MTERQASLLVFTLGPGGDCARRRLLPARVGDLARGLLRASLDAALSAGRGVGCRLEVSSPHALEVGPGVRLVGQRGRTFGERFRDAVREARERADGPLVVVGSDVPGLTSRHLEQALERLGDDAGRVVIGPSPDGGFYLLATNRPLDAELDRVRWRTSATLATLLAALRDSGLEVSLLEPLRDLDRPRDLVAWLTGEATRSPGWRRYAALLRRLLAALRRPPRPRSLGRPAAGASLALAGRGPPL